MLQEYDPCDAGTWPTVMWVAVFMQRLLRGAEVNLLVLERFWVSKHGLEEIGNSFNSQGIWMFRNSSSLEQQPSRSLSDQVCGTSERCCNPWRDVRNGSEGRKCFSFCFCSFSLTSLAMVSSLPQIQIKCGLLWNLF